MAEQEAAQTQEAAQAQKEAPEAQEAAQTQEAVQTQEAAEAQKEATEAQEAAQTQEEVQTQEAAEAQEATEAQLMVQKEAAQAQKEAAEAQLMVHEETVGEHLQLKLKVNKAALMTIPVSKNFWWCKTISDTGTDVTGVDLIKKLGVSQKKLPPAKHKVQTEPTQPEKLMSSSRKQKAEASGATEDLHINPSGNPELPESLQSTSQPIQSTRGRGR